MTIVLGDFNALIGHGSGIAGSGVVGPSAYHDLFNKDDQILDNLCEVNKLRFLRTRFPQRRGRRWAWQHPGGSCCAQLDMFCSQDDGQTRMETVPHTK